MTAVPSPPCDHPDFEATVEVARLTQTEGGPVLAYSAAVRARCRACGEPFVWIGVPSGLSPRRPMSSLDGYELRAPIRPASTPPTSGLEGPGFHIERTA